MPESVNFDQIADRYDETRGGTERGRRVASELAPHLPAGALLEIGVGTGLIASVFAEHGWSVAGIDLSERMLAHARRRIPGRVARADATAIPLTDGSVDACVAVHVLHLVGNIPAVLREVARVLRPGGRLAVAGAGESTVTSDISEIIRSMNDGLSDSSPRPDTPEAVIHLAAENGLRLVADFAIDRSGGPATPAAVVDQIQRRTWSQLWDLPTEKWATFVEPALDALRTLPHPSRPRPTGARTPSLVFENTGLSAA
ncbi:MULTISPECIES: class I SAM-dependent methyltransferase [Protofrankia]|uniref:Methyltransferase type 11 n=1 Tax=Candidatus Protofrankia datiscae TaxID=2716812 RepID=F8AWZ4_9ACTN|nr:MULTISPECIES: class I SAM-dependent methyltransferase [Protofrankia]AEH11438.1 Methyltransferase type 11 [Candidatus Protofrankia datiscae]